MYLAFTVHLAVVQPWFRCSVVTLAQYWAAYIWLLLSFTSVCPPPDPLYVFHLSPHVQWSMDYLGAGLGFGELARVGQV